MNKDFNTKANRDEEEYQYIYATSVVVNDNGDVSIHADGELVYIDANDYEKVIKLPRGGRVKVSDMAGGNWHASREDRSPYDFHFSSDRRNLSGKLLTINVTSEDLLNPTQLEEAKALGKIRLSNLSKELQDTVKKELSTTSVESTKEQLLKASEQILKSTDKFFQELGKQAKALYPSMGDEEYKEIYKDKKFVSSFNLNLKLAEGNLEAAIKIPQAAQLANKSHLALQENKSKSLSFDTNFSDDDHDNEEFKALLNKLPKGIGFNDFSEEVSKLPTKKFAVKGLGFPAYISVDFGEAGIGISFAEQATEESLNEGTLYRVLDTKKLLEWLSNPARSLNTLHTFTKSGAFSSDKQSKSSTKEEEAFEKKLKDYLDSIITDVKISERLVPVQFYSVRKIDEEKLDGEPIGNFDVDLYVKKAGYLPSRFDKGVVKDLEDILAEWALDNVDGEVSFKVSLQ